MAVIVGTAGEDTLRGTAVADRILAGAGDDVIWARAGNDTVYGGANGDRISGDEGNDVLFGLGGSDTLRAGDGDDRLLGGAGSDWIFDDAGADVMRGNTGADILCAAGDSSRDVFDGGAGSDFIWASSDAVVRINLGLGTLRIGDGARDALVSIEDAYASGPGNVFLNGSGAGNLLNLASAGSAVVYAGNGDDTVLGGSRADSLTGGAGNDFIDAGTAYDSGAQVLSGDAGNDVLLTGFGVASLTGGEGTDEFWFVDNNADSLSIAASISDYEQGERIALDVIPANWPDAMVFVGLTDQPLGDNEVGYARDGEDTVLTANTGAGSYATVRLVGFTGDLDADAIVLNEFAPTYHDF